MQHAIGNIEYAVAIMLFEISLFNMYFKSHQTNIHVLLMVRHMPREKPLEYEGEENPAGRGLGSYVSSPQFRQVLNPPIGR